MNTERIRVLLADNHTVVRHGFRLILEREGMEVVGEAEDGREAVRLVGTSVPGVVVMEVDMPRLNGIDAAQQMLAQRPTPRILFLTACSDMPVLRSAVTMGCSGFLVKHCSAEDLIRAVQEASAGKAFYSPAITQHMLSAAFCGPANDPGTNLTTREREVLQLITEGFANKQIADELCISSKTVEKHRQALMQKLDIHDVAGLTRFALSHGIIRQPPRLDVICARP